MKGTLINKYIKYNYILLNLDEFVKWIKNNKEIRMSIENLLSIHRNQNDFKIIQLLNEAFEDINKNTYYFFIYKDNEIVTSSRLIIDNKKKAYMNMVHTNINYRNLGFCKKQIKKFIFLIKDKYKKIILHVDKINTYAIKCYIACEFKIKKTSDISKTIYEMIYK